MRRLLVAILERVCGVMKRYCIALNKVQWSRTKLRQQIPCEDDSKKSKGKNEIQGSFTAFRMTSVVKSPNVWVLHYVLLTLMKYKSVATSNCSFVSGVFRGCHSRVGVMTCQWSGVPTRTGMVKPGSSACHL